MKDDAIHHAVTVPLPPAEAFAAFTERMAEWWPPEYTWAGAALSAVAMEPRAGGRWYERDTRGAEQAWGEVRAWEPPRRVVLSWGHFAHTAAGAGPLARERDRGPLPAGGRRRDARGGRAPRVRAARGGRRGGLSRGDGLARRLAHDPVPLRRCLHVASGAHSRRASGRQGRIGRP